MKRNRCISKAIFKNNMQGKDFDKDRYISTRRVPYERVFSKQDKRYAFTGGGKKFYKTIPIKT